MAEIGYGYGSECHLLRFLGWHRNELNAHVRKAIGCKEIKWLDFGFDSRKHRWPDAEIRGLDFLIKGTGDNGLCLWGGGDWNDSLNSAGLKGIGESVWLTEAALLSIREFIGLLQYSGYLDKVPYYETAAVALTAALKIPLRRGSAL